MYENSSYIRSPGYPLKYAHNIFCQWIVTVEEGKEILINLTKFQTETNHDKLIIYDGEDYSSEVIGNFSGTILSSIIISSSNKVYLEFRTDGSIEYTGFEFKYSTISYSSKYYY